MLTFPARGVVNNDAHHAIMASPIDANGNVMFGSYIHPLTSSLVHVDKEALMLTFDF